jgi:hypothetical protein
MELLLHLLHHPFVVEIFDAVFPQLIFLLAQLFAQFANLPGYL